VKKLPPDVLAYFKEQGAKGGRIGGRRALETMTPAQRVARAKKASAAAAAARMRSAKEDQVGRRNRSMPNPFFDHPVLNSPCEYRRKHWELDADGQPTQQQIERRRRAEFLTPIPKPKKRRATVHGEGC
jgi:hypothetical protein